jgi:hypothetical protein
MSRHEQDGGHGRLADEDGQRHPGDPGHGQKGPKIRSTHGAARTSNPDERQTPSFRTDFTFDDPIQAICERLLP